MIGTLPRFRLIALLTFFIVAPVDGRPPNVVVIMADDLDDHDLSCCGNTEIRTSVIDSLAVEGVRLTSFYAGSESDALIAAIDLLPTLVHACGIDPASLRRGST